MDPYLQVLAHLNAIAGCVRLAHWNVVGPDFYSAHVLFQKIYEMLEVHIDPVAEQLRGVGMEIEANVLNQTPEIGWESVQDLTSTLLLLSQGLSDSVKNGLSQAEHDGNTGFVSLLEVILFDINKIQYLLRSSLQS